MIKILEQQDSQELEDLLCAVNGEEYRALAQACIACMFSHDFRRPVFLTAKEGQALIGAAAISEEMFTVNTWGISWVSVLPGHRGKGLGLELVSACVAEISKRISKRSTIILGTYPGKTRLYEKAGFSGAATDHEGGCFMTRFVDPAL